MFVVWRALIFNPQPQIREIPLGNGQVCCVIDDVLANPEAWVEQAVRYRAAFLEAPGNAYPGIELPVPAAVNEALIGYFSTYVNRRFGIRRITRSYSRLSMVTKRPEQLRPIQCFCHRDGTYVPAGKRMLASVLYLFPDEALGGTTLYRPIRPDVEIAALQRDAEQIPFAAFSGKYGIQPGYMTGGNDWFEPLLNVPARWNRMVIYDGMVFHSADIHLPERMNDDPRSGRLSLNGFYTGRRTLA